MTTKLHAVADARGRPVRLGLSAGQRHDAPQALPLLEGLAPAYLVADRGYDSDPLTNVVDVYVRRLRAKLHWDSETGWIRTVRNYGYRLDPPTTALS